MVTLENAASPRSESPPVRIAPPTDSAARAEPSVSMPIDGSESVPVTRTSSESAPAPMPIPSFTVGLTARSSPSVRRLTVPAMTMFTFAVS